MASNLAKTYNSFSGVDITPVFKGHPVGECQGISYSISREKAPLYTLGSANPRSFSRGKRGIAGAVVFMVFDRSALFQSLKTDSNIWGNTWEAPSAIKEREASADAFTGLQAVTGTNANTDNIASKSVTINKAVIQAYYHDQVPPFDIMLLAATERGHGAIMQILGAEILNCGSGVSVDDVTTDESCTYIATGVIPWHSQTFNDPAGTENANSVYKYNGNLVKS